MMNLYYKIWVDMISKAKSRPENINDWKIMTLLIMSSNMAVLFGICMAFFQKIIGLYFYFLNIDLFPGENIDAFLSFFILFLLPMTIINYLLIFKNNRYEMLIKKYKSHNGKLFTRYFLISLGIPFVTLIIGMIIKYSG